MATQTIPTAPVTVVRRAGMAVHFPIAPAVGRDARARAAAAQLVFGRSCRRRVVG